MLWLTGHVGFWPLKSGCNGRQSTTTKEQESAAGTLVRYYQVSDIIRSKYSWPLLGSILSPILFCNIVVR